MNAMIRFEALRFCRQPRIWLFFGLSVMWSMIPLLANARHVSSMSLGLPVYFSIFTGYMVWTLLDQTSRLDGMGQDSQYLFIRAATRSQLLMGRWVFYACVALILWSCIALAHLASGQLSADSSARLRWQTVSNLEDAGYTLDIAPKDRADYVLWRLEDDRREFEGGGIQLPWGGALPLVLTFLGFLLGLASGSVSGPVVRPLRKRLRDPALYLQLGLLLGALGVLSGPLLDHGPQDWMLIAAYTHIGSVVAIGIGLIALYAAAALSVWRRADLA